MTSHSLELNRKGKSIGQPLEKRFNNCEEGPIQMSAGRFSATNEPDVLWREVVPSYNVTELNIASSILFKSPCENAALVCLIFQMSKVHCSFYRTTLRADPCSLTPMCSRCVPFFFSSFASRVSVTVEAHWSYSSARALTAVIMGNSSSSVYL